MQGCSINVLFCSTVTHLPTAAGTSAEETALLQKQSDRVWAKFKREGNSAASVPPQCGLSDCTAVLYFDHLEHGTPPDHVECANR